jgi:nucleotide-binding universal stress UspA family protein
MVRILIGYNGSEASMAALADLRDAGLPAATQVLVLSVAELWVEPRSVESAVDAAAEAKKYLNSEFPEWLVYVETASGSPAREILARAETFKPDLIVLGEPLQNIRDGNIFLGQTSKVVVNEAECAVRIARHSNQTAGTAKRILVGFDGSAGAMNAVRSIATKEWRDPVEVRLLAVTELGVLTSISGSGVPVATKRVDLSSVSRWSEKVVVEALRVLKQAGITASLETRLGNAKDVIIEEAENWAADAIYVGPHGSANSFDRFILGSVSASVAARASCSVEVVRHSRY